MMEPTLCRKCGVILIHSATIAMGICGSCLIAAENRPDPMVRPKYGKSLIPEKEPVPEIQ